ncbi:MAG: phage head morphogenesis protein, partial [Armatimonadetes bacterium]|nr:phage head morphogenesis protein [Armatimonadota bacterium]
LGALEALDPKNFPLAQIRAREDACPFCRAMHNKVLRIDQHHAYLPPFHINCRCVVVRLSEGAAPVDFDPDDEEIKRNLHHAHFVADLVKGRQVRYEALKVPARVEGRDFIFRRVRDKETGRWLSKLEFRQGQPTWLKFEGFENLLPEKGQEPVFDLQRIGRAIRQLRQAYPELFHRADVRSVVILSQQRGAKVNFRGQVGLSSGTHFLNLAQIAKAKPVIGVTDANDQFLLTLVEELLHTKVKTYSLNHPNRWERLIKQILPKGLETPPIYRRGIEVQREWRRDYHEWVTKVIAARLVGKSDLLSEPAMKVAQKLWDEVK